MICQHECHQSEILYAEKENGGIGAVSTLTRKATENLPIFTLDYDLKTGSLVL